MKAEIESAITELATKAKVSGANGQSGAALHLSQSALNLAHALALLHEMSKPIRAQPCVHEMSKPKPPTSSHSYVEPEQMA